MTGKQPVWSTLNRILILGLSLFFLTACSLLNSETSEEGALPNGALATVVTLECNEACADRGQCGVAPDQSQVILGHPNQPTLALTTHLMRFPAGVQATVIDQRSEQISSAQSGDLAGSTDFYLIQLQAEQLSRQGWIPAWCTAAP